MSDYCHHCAMRGDYDKCSETPCAHHEGWVDLVRIGRIKNLEAKVEPYKKVRDELTKIAAKLVCQQFLPSEYDEDYAQKTYSARRVARMMEDAHKTIKEIGIKLGMIAADIK